MLNNQNNKEIGLIEEMSKIQNLPIDKINMRLDKYNYRNTSSTDEYDSNNENIKELAESIRYQGLINPITVIKSTRDKDTYDIVAGHRRFVACTILGMRELPCHLLDSNKEAEQIYLIGLTENIQRNNLKPLEEAIGFKKYMELFNIQSIRQLSIKIGKSQSYIHSRLFLFDLPIHIIHAINSKQITMTLLDDISTAVINKILKNELIEFIYEKKLNTEDGRNLLRIVKGYEIDYLHKNRENGLTKEKLVDMDTLSLEQVFKRYNEQCNEIIDNSNNNILDTISQQSTRENNKDRIKKLGYEMKYRSRFEIITSILKIIVDNSRYDQVEKKYRGISANKIMYLNYLSFAQIKDYTYYLLEKDMITKLELNNKETRYRERHEFILTHKGLKFLQQAINLFKIIDIKDYADIDIDYYERNKVLVLESNYSNKQQEQEEE